MKSLLHNTCRRKYDVKAVTSKAQVPSTIVASAS